VSSRLRSQGTLKDLCTYVDKDWAQFNRSISIEHGFLNKDELITVLKKLMQIPPPEPKLSGKESYQELIDATAQYQQVVTEHIHEIVDEIEKTRCQRYNEWEAARKKNET